MVLRRIRRVQLPMLVGPRVWLEDACAHALKAPRRAHQLALRAAQAATRAGDTTTARAAHALAHSLETED